MKTFLLLCAVCGLALTIIPPVFFAAGAVELQWTQQLMTLGMILWFGGVVPRLSGRSPHR